MPLPTRPSVSARRAAGAGGAGRSCARRGLPAAATARKAPIPLERSHRWSCTCTRSRRCARARISRARAASSAGPSWLDGAFWRSRARLVATAATARALGGADRDPPSTATDRSGCGRSSAPRSCGSGRTGSRRAPRRRPRHPRRRLSLQRQRRRVDPRECAGAHAHRRAGGDAPAAPLTSSGPRSRPRPTSATRVPARRSVRVQHVTWFRSPRTSPRRSTARSARPAPCPAMPPHLPPRAFGDRDHQGVDGGAGRVGGRSVLRIGSLRIGALVRFGSDHAGGFGGLAEGGVARDRPGSVGAAAPGTFWAPLRRPAWGSVGEAG